MKEHIPQILITLGAFLTIAGGFMSYLQNNESTKELKQQTELNGELSSKNNEIANQNLTLIEQNINLSSKLIDKADDIAASVTGGDSYCYLSMSWMKQNEATLMIINDGNHPMYKVQMRIVDLAKYKTGNKVDLVALKGTIANFDELTAGHAMEAGKLKVDSNIDKLSYNIFYSSRNGSFTQKLRLTRIGETTWVCATQVTKTFDAELLYEKIDEDYPKDVLEEQGWN